VTLFPVFLVIRGGAGQSAARSGQGAQEDALRFGVDVLDLGNRDDQEAPAETAGANDECVRPILAGGVAQPLDLAEAAVRRVDAEALAATQPVVGVEPGVPGQIGVSAQGGSLHRSPENPASGFCPADEVGTGRGVPSAGEERLRWDSLP
jgi:hypothetical protein